MIGCGAYREPIGGTRQKNAIINIYNVSPKNIVHTGAIAKIQCSDNKPVLSLQDISVQNILGTFTSGIYFFIWLYQNPSCLQ